MTKRQYTNKKKVWTYLFLILIGLGSYTPITNTPATFEDNRDDVQRFYMVVKSAVQAEAGEWY